MDTGHGLFLLYLPILRHFRAAICFAEFILSSSLSPCIIADMTLCNLSMIITSVSFGSSVSPLIIRQLSRLLVLILLSCRFIRYCSAVSWWTFLFSLRFSSFRSLISLVCFWMVGLVCTAVHSDVCITFRASLIEASMVLLMLLFSLSSSSDISLSLLLVIFSDSLSSIFLISSNILGAVVASTWISDIVAVIPFSSFSCRFAVLSAFVKSGNEFLLLLNDRLSPVGLLLFLLLPLMVRVLCPWMSFNFLPLLKSDIFHTWGHVCFVDVTSEIMTGCAPFSCLVRRLVLWYTW